MMKYCLLLSFCIGAVVVHAQDLVIHVPGPRSYTYTECHVDPGSTDEGPAGKNVRWDFSGRPYTPGRTTFFCEITDTPYTTWFPHDNFMEIRTLDNWEDIMVYIIDTDRMVTDGGVSLAKGQQPPAGRRSVKDTFFHYPLYYGKSWSVTHMGARCGFEVDGEGTIITPDSREYKALRVKMTIRAAGKRPACIAIDQKEIAVWRCDDFFWFIPEMPCSPLYHISRSQKESRSGDKINWHKEENEVTYNRPVSGSAAKPAKR